MIRAAFWPLVLLSLLLVLGILGIPPIPKTQTRYLSVAWEMWLNREFLVPYLNGEAYSHKPPLFMWSIHLGWSIFGVSDFWARLAAPLYSLGTVVLMPALARRLWPDQDGIAALAPVTLLAVPVFLIYSCFAMMDGMLTFFVTLGWLGIAMVAQGETRRGALLVALATGLGILSKGPVVFVFLLPPVVLAPVWIGGLRPDYRSWSVAFAIAFGAGILIALLWAASAAIMGGSTFARELFLTQTADRVAGDLGHPRPWWWFLPFVPFVFFPWIWMPSVWARLAAGLRMAEPGTRFAVIGLVVPFTLFTIFPGKQLHYLMPMAVALALLAARTLADVRPVALDRLAMVLTYLFMVLALLQITVGVATSVDGFLPALTARLEGVQAYLRNWTPWGGMLLLTFLLLSLFWRPEHRVGGAFKVAVLILGLAAAALVEGRLSVYPYLDTRPGAEAILAIEEEGRPVAFAGRYYGEYHFSGRLRQPFVELPTPIEQMSWAAANPDGVILSHFRSDPDGLPARPLAVYVYKKEWLGIWPTATVLETGGKVLEKRP